MPRPTLRDVHVNRPLTNISIAYANELYIAGQVFPVVSVEKKSDLYFVFDRGAWFRNRSGPRAPGRKAPRADYAISTASYICINDSLAKGIPDEVRDNADMPLQPDVDATKFVTDGLQLGLEIRVADLVITNGSSNWGYAASPGTQWTSDTSDPWGDIDSAVNGVVSTIGRQPNVALMSWDVWRNLRQHPDFLDRVKHTRPSGRIEPGDLRSWFGFDRVLIGTSLKDTAEEGQTASMTYVWGDGFWCGYTPPTPALAQPAAGYTLVWGTRQVQRLRDNFRHEDVIEAEWFTDEVITASDGGGIVYNAV